MSKPPISVGSIVQWDGVNLGWVVGAISEGERIPPFRDWAQAHAGEPMVHDFYMAGYDAVNFKRGRSWTYIVRSAGNAQYRLVQAEKILLVKKTPGVPTDLETIRGNLTIKLVNDRVQISCDGVELTGITYFEVKGSPNEQAIITLHSVLGRHSNYGKTITEEEA